MAARSATRRSLAFAVLVAAAGVALFVALRGPSDTAGTEKPDDPRPAADAAAAASLAGRPRNEDAPPSPTGAWLPTILEPKEPVSMAPGPRAIVGTVLN